MSKTAKIVLTGKPNVGKSSLMNQLAREPVAIVTAVPGTTRDVVKQTLNLKGVAFEFADTAGIREATDIIEKEGIQRARNELETANLVIEVIDDAADDNTEESFEGATPTIRVLNKIDLSERRPGEQPSETITTIAVSAITGAGFVELENAILSILGFSNTVTSTPFSARERHVAILQATYNLLHKGIEQFHQTGAGEILAEDLRSAHETLGEITGVLGADDLLGEIFSSFCIGK